VRAALIAGSMYEPLYDALEEFSATRGTVVEVGYRGYHPALFRNISSSR